jgi:peptide/nickel transport system substrate-binding protein
MRLVGHAFTAILAVGLGLAGTGFLGGPALAQKRGGTLVQITQPEPPSLGSYISTANPIGQVAAKIYDGLLEYDFDLKPLPGLAESWTVSDDGKTVTFRLRSGVTFHDGGAFTSADVQFTFMEVLKKVHPRGINTFADVIAVDTPDAQTAVFRLNRPAPYMMSALSGYESPILPKNVFSQGDIRTHANANNPIGSGPFKFVEWRRGEFVRLDRNPTYWKQGLPYLDRIVVRFIGDTGTRAAALEKGEAHIAGFGAVPYNDVKKLEKLPNIQIVTRGYEMLSPVVELMFNTKKAPFDNQKVRQAISYAIDRKFVIDNIWFGFGKPTNGPISSNFAAAGLYSADVTNYNTPDGVEKANKLLDEAGFPRKADGFRFEIIHDVTPYGEEWRRFGEYTQQALAKIGVKASIRYEDVATWLKRIYTDYDYDMSSNHLFNLADPVLGVHRGFHSRFIRPGTVFVNGVRWGDPRSDEMMDRATIEPDAKKRSELYTEIQKLVVDAAPLAWTHEISFATVLDKRYRDVIISPLGIFSSFDRAWRE